MITSTEYWATSVTWVMAISRISAPAVVASAAATGSIAARHPRKMKNSASSSTGSATASPRIRSFVAAAFPSPVTAISPPTWTVAPGTAPRAAARSAVTRFICAFSGVFLRTETTITLACPSGDRSARPAGPV